MSKKHLKSKCNRCNKAVRLQVSSVTIMSNSEQEHSGAEIPHVELQLSNSAFGKRIREFNILNFGHRSIDDFLIHSFNIYESQIAESVSRFNMIKTLSYFSGEFERSFVHEDNRDPLFERRLIYVPTKVKEISSSTNVSEYFKSNVIDYVKRKVEEALIEGSGFTLSRIDKLTVQIFKYEPLRGSGFIDLPKAIKNKKSIVNLKNTFNECFKWSILAAMHNNEVHARKVNDAASYRYWANEMNFEGIDFPVRLNQIHKFMDQNEGIAINVYHFDVEKKRVCPLFLALKPVEYRYVHLLLLTETESTHSNEEDNVSVRSHYCWIKNLSALVHAQTTKNNRKLSICDRCLNHFSSEEKLGKHRMICTIMNNCAIEMPVPGQNYEAFKNFKNVLKIPFIVYADAEALLKIPETPVYSVDCSTKALHHHEVHSIGYYFRSEYDESKSRYASNRGPNCLNWFMDELTEIAIEVFDFLDDRKPMQTLTEEEKIRFDTSTVCHICRKSLSDVAVIEEMGCPVQDHCHLTGAFRGAAHNTCNLQFQITRNIPVVMHNLSGYDSHLFIRKLSCNELIPGKITIIPNNAERYISFIKTMQDIGQPRREVKFKFIDSLRFMSASLDYLAKILPHEKKQILKSECVKSGYCSDEMFAMLVRKGVFPYEYIDDYEKLKETKLPPIESFYSSLTDSSVSESDYKHAQNVWQKFGIRSIGEYSDLYLKTDVLLLADVFENFRATCQSTHSLDPAHYFGTPGLSIDAMLKYTGVSIELFTDVDMLMFTERGIRGGVSQINKRYVKANNIYMGSQFDSKKETSYIMYLDGKYFADFEVFRL